MRLSGHRSGRVRGPLPRRGPLRSEFVAKVIANCGARGLAIVGLALATVLVARAGGPSTVGAYALLRMLTGLVGVLAVLGLPSALAFFLAAHRNAQGLWPTLVALCTAGSLVGSVLWAAASPLLKGVFFPNDSVVTIAWAGLAVATQLFLTIGKNSLQGLQDNRGGDVVIAAEELAFLPTYALALVGGLQGSAAVIAGLVLADILVGLDAWRRVARRMSWRRLGLGAAPHGWWGRPDRTLAKEVVSYGLRGQVGGFMSLLNLRLDFAILGAIAGPAVLGTYAVASKFAELLRLPGTAMTWVSYPRLAATTDSAASGYARRLLRPTLLGVLAAAVPAALLVAPVVHLLYGAAFDPAIAQARVLLVGMLLGGASGVASGYLYGRGRPGLNSVAMGIGLLVTIGLDLLLIPAHGAMGASIASTTAYLTSDLLLIAMLLRLTSRRRSPESATATVEVQVAP